MKIQTDYSIWTNELVNQMIQDQSLSNKGKMNILSELIHWKYSNLDININIYPIINLVMGYYGLSEGKSFDQINEMIQKDYNTEFVNSVNNLSNKDILSGLILINFIYSLSNP